MTARAWRSFAPGWSEKTGARAQEIAVAIEVPRGPVVEVLLERGFQVFAINPKQLDRFRDRFSMSGAKDDSRDALVLGHSLRTDPQAFRRLAIDDPLVIECANGRAFMKSSKQDQNRLANRVRDQLVAVLSTNRRVGRPRSNWFLDLWEKAPTPAKAARVSEQAVARILKNHRIRRFDAGEVLRILRQAPLAVAPRHGGSRERAHPYACGTPAAGQSADQGGRASARRALCAIEAHAETERGRFAEQHDVAILRSMPGLGRITIARLLVRGLRASAAARLSGLARLVRPGAGLPAAVARRPRRAAWRW